MSSLQQAIDRRRAESSPDSQLCHVAEGQLAALCVITSADERWLFPWPQLVYAQFAGGSGRETLQLTFASHVVTITGRQLTALCELIARNQLALVRPAPAKFAKAAEDRPFIEALHVALAEARGVASAE